MDLTKIQRVKVKAHPPIKDVFPLFVQESYADFLQNVFGSFLVIFARPPLGTIPSLETPQASPRDIHHILINSSAKICEFLESPKTQVHITDIHCVLYHRYTLYSLQIFTAYDRNTLYFHQIFTGWLVYTTGTMMFTVDRILISGIFFVMPCIETYQKVNYVYLNLVCRIISNFTWILELQML